MRCHAIGRIVCLALSLLLVPLASAAQQPGKIYRVGYLAPAQPINGPFREAMRRLGYLEGGNLVIEGRFAGEQPDRLPALAAELVQLPVDVLVTLSTPAALAAIRATTTIPIVMAGVSEPVERGLVVSLARPGGQPSSRHPLLWWGMNSTVFGKYPLDQHPEPHGTSSRALNA